MVEYLKKHYDQPILRQDARVYGEACLKYRPDVMYAGPNRVVMVECDEHQHKWSNGNYECDERRISELYDEFPGKEFLVIRWNPDAFKLKSGKKAKKNFKRRCEALLKVLREYETIKMESKIQCVYMFYDHDNERLAKNIPYKLIQ